MDASPSLAFLCAVCPRIRSWRSETLLESLLCQPASLSLLVTCMWQEGCCWQSGRALLKKPPVWDVALPRAARLDPSPQGAVAADLTKNPQEKPKPVIVRSGSCAW